MLPYSIKRGALTTNSKTIPAITASILIIALIFPYLCSNTQAQTTFTPADKFDIPAYNGSVRFVVNGSCAEAVLDNDTWTFKRLMLNGSFPLGDLKVSAKNSKITILSYFSGSFFSRRLGSLRCTIEGQGTQAVNLGFNSSSPADPTEWTVVTDNSVFLAEGEAWKLLPDETVIISGVTGNLTVARYNFGLPTDNRPFYMQHYVIILTGVAVAVTVAVAAVIQFKSRVGK